MTLQGTKWASFGEKRCDFATGQVLVVTVHLPSHGMVSVASPTEPYLGLVMALDRAIMQETVEETGMHLQAASKTKARGSFVFRKLQRPSPRSIQGSWVKYATGSLRDPEAIR
jgi:AraC-type transcriptional regulator N-terminus